MTTDLGHPSYQGHLNDRCATIAEVLKTGGYRTLMSGKWHVGGSYSIRESDTWQAAFDDVRHPNPLTRGFERYYGTLEGCGNYFQPHTLMKDGRFIYETGEDFYYTDAITDEAVKMTEQYGAREAPFFLFVSYTAPHWPLHALPEDIARYESRYRGGWDEIRKDRYESMVGLGIIDSKWKISPRDETAPPWSEVEDKDWEAMRMAVYAAQIDRMDQGIRRIVQSLESMSIYENTLIVFLSDNGGCAEFLAENGFVQRLLYPNRDGTFARAGNFPGLMPGAENTYMSYDLPWANASNTPFRLYKHWVHEGGVATPFIVSWPAAIGQHRVVHEPVHLIDIMATFTDAAGAAYPEEREGKAIPAPQGESLLPALAQESWSRETPIFWEHEGNCAMRQGQWKIVKKYPGGWELYDMTQDRTEQTDLIGKNRSKAGEMEKQYDDWSRRCAIEPWDRFVKTAPE